MGKITTLDYVLMAARVYHIDLGASSTGHIVGNYECGLFEEGMSWGATFTDFKGCVYADRQAKEVVVAFQGTEPSKLGDLVSDLQIVIGMLPQYCSAALRLFERTKEAYPNYGVSLVGHSLGGGIAQVIGHWTGAPFVTFNAPGMWGDIQKSKLLFVWSPSNAWRSLKGSFNGSLLAKQKAATGRNFRNVLDPVSAYGSHYGPVTRFWGKGVHGIDDVVERVRTSRWANIHPLDPAHKEWGEL